MRTKIQYLKTCSLFI